MYFCESNMNILVSIGPSGSEFEVGLSAAAPAGQVHTLLHTKSWFFYENWCTFCYERFLLLWIKNEYAVNKGPSGSAFEVGLSAAAPAGQLHTLLHTKSWYFYEN